MKDGDGRWRGRFRAAGAAIRRPRLELTEDPPVEHGAAAAPSSAVGNGWEARIGSAAIAFRGYDVTNLGRSLELLDHPVYGPTLADELATASAIASDAL